MSPTEGGLHDRFGRRVDDLRVSITERCDLRCCYCLPKGQRSFEDRERCLDLEQIERVVGVFAALGVGRVRLTGGEPLLRRGLVQLVGRLAALPGVQELSLSTNGTQLADQAASLRQAGIACLNVSLDSLRADRMRQITGSDVLHAVIDGLMAARQVGFDPIRLNMVLLRGVNDDEVDDMAAFCIAHGFVLRLFEAMPAGDTGPHAQSADLLPLRLRLSVDGRLHTCLGRDHSLPLRSLLCSGASDVDLIAAIRGAIALRPERHECREAPGKVMRVMARTGG